MRATVLILISVMFVSARAGQTQDLPCVLEPSKMPETWRAPASLSKKISNEPWSKREQLDAESAIEVGLDEIILLFEQNPAEVQNLWDDSIEALVQVTHGSINNAAIDRKAKAGARKNLDALIAPYRDLDANWAICDEFDELLPIAIFAHRLFPPNDPRTDIVTKRTNAAMRDCGSLDGAIQIDFREILADSQAKPDNLEDLFDLQLWAIWFIEAGLYPNLKLPEEAYDYPAKVWNYFRAFRFDSAAKPGQQANDTSFALHADLALHLAHIPTGAHRFPLFVKDGADLYRYYRENFYSAMQSGDLGFFASFVSTLRQYGCTAETDIQVRDGTRYLLAIFHKSSDKWMNYRAPGEEKDEIESDGLIQQTLKAILGVRRRKPDDPLPGTYGGAVRTWLKPLQ